MRSSIIALFFISSICFSAQELKQKIPLSESQIKKKNQAFGFDIGLSGSLLLSDQSLDTLGLGIGSQYSFYYHFHRDKTWDIKLKLQRLQTQQEIITETNWREMVDSGYRFKRLKQAWWLLGASTEKEINNFWQLDWGAGWAAGEKVKSLTISTGTNPEPIKSNFTTNSFFYFDIGFVFRYPYKKNMLLTARFGSFLLLQSLYGKDAKDKSLILLPIISSVGIEI